MQGDWHELAYAIADLIDSLYQKLTTQLKEVQIAGREKLSETQPQSVPLADENAHLQAVLTWYRQRDEVILRLNSRFRATPDLLGILQATATEIGHMLKAESCFITLDIEMGSVPHSLEYHTPHSSTFDEKPAKLVAPIMLQHELGGTITVHDKASRKWLREEVTFVHTIASELALLLTNARLTAENQRRQREVNQLRALAQLTSTESDPFRLAQHCTRSFNQYCSPRSSSCGSNSVNPKS